jgi:hypothetical protein
MGATLILAPGPTLPYKSGSAAPAGGEAPGQGIPSTRPRTIAANCNSPVAPCRVRHSHGFVGPAAGWLTSPVLGSHFNLWHCLWNATRLQRVA